MTHSALTSAAAALCLAAALLAPSTSFGQRAHTPAAGSAERKAIMDAIRVPAEQTLQQKVIFKVDQLRVAGDWAFARVSPIQPDGGEIDFMRTKFKKQIEFGAFDPQGEALLFKKSNGSWSVIEWEFGHTDVASAGWSAKHAGLPASLFQ